MDKMTIKEMMDYVDDIKGDGVTLTANGIGAATTILERRRDWTTAHSNMLARIRNGEMKLPLKLAKLVNRTRLGDAIDLAKRLTRKERKADRRRIRINAASARTAA